MDTLRLIDEVKCRRTLWDTNDERYSHREASRAHWKQVAEEMNLSVGEVKTRWRSLRDTFRKELKKAGADESVVPKWPYFKFLTFLVDSFSSRNLSNAIPNTPECADDKYTASALAEAQLTVLGVKEEEDLSSNDNTFFHVKKTVKRNEGNSSEDRVCVNNDDDYQFLVSLLPYLKEIPRSRKMMVRSKLQQVFIDELEFTTNRSDKCSPQRHGWME